MFLFYSVILFSHCISAFFDTEVRESIGGLIAHPQTLEARKKIDAESNNQSPFSIVAASTTNTTTYNLNLICPRDELTFFQNTVPPFLLVCNLSGYANASLSVAFDTDIHAIATLLPPFWVYLSPGPVNMSLEISIHPLRMGSVYLSVWVREAIPQGRAGTLYPFDRSNESSVKDYKMWILNGGEAEPMGFHLKIMRPRGVLEIVFRVVVAVMVCGLTLVMGCDLDARLIWNHFKKPVSPLIGFVCQFGLMPVIAFCLAMVVPIKPEFGFGLLTTGCCPGGGGSNIWTLLLNGDLNLSMTMTFISSIAALGMMPLMLFIYGRFFLDPKVIHIPYLQIAGQLCYIVFPVIIGILIKWRYPKFAKRTVQLILRPMAITFIFVIIGFGTYVNWPIYGLLGAYPLLFPTAMVLPWAGFLLSGIFSFICRRTRAEILTISIETGIQNIGIAILVLVYSMPQPEGDIGAAMPLVVSIVTPFPLMLAAIVTSRKKCSPCCREKGKESKGERREEEEQKLSLKYSGDQTSNATTT